MYSSGYSQVNKYTPRAQKKMKYHSKGKSCGYYMRIVFFFSSLIQSLIIVSLVLFLIYGKTQDSASVTRVQDLEERFSRVSLENVALREQRKNLTNLLNATVVAKARNDWDLVRLRHLSNQSLFMFQDFDRMVQQCNKELMDCKLKFNAPPRLAQFSTGVGCNCGYLERENAKLDLLRSNFTQTTKLMKMEMDQIVKQRDNFSLEAIHLRRDRSILQMELHSYKDKAKQEFYSSLTTVTNVSRAFLKKIDSLFPRHLAFQLTCAKQRAHLDQIRTNCTNLSREVEDKLQQYLNTVGDQVSSIQEEKNHLKAENSLLSEDYRQCSQNRMGLIREYKQNREEVQRKHDQEKEKLLMDKIKLHGDIDVLTNTVKYKSKEVDHLTERIKQLNMSCMTKVGFGGQGLGLRPNTQNQLGGAYGGVNLNPLGKPISGGLGPNFGTGSAFNKPVSTGTGSSSSYLPSGSSSSQSNTGYGLSKPGSTGTGSSSSSYLPSGSSSSQSNTGYGLNKPGSTGTGSSSSYLPSGSSSSQSNTGYGLNKPGSTGTGSSSSYLPSGSSSSQSNTGYGLNKPGSTGTGSSSSYLPSGSSSSQSNTGYGLNKPGSTGGVGSTGSSSGLSSGGLSKTGLLGRGSTGGSSSSSASTSKSGPSSSGYSFLGFGSSKTDQSKTVPQKPSSGSSYGGTGSSLGGGRTSGLGGGSGTVSQHIRELQRLINPSSPQEKQELSRMLG